MDVRRVMIEGDSGILGCAPPDYRPDWRPGLQVIELPNKSRIEVYTADRPDRLRGPQFDWAWCDELAAWRYPEAAWDMLLYGLRLGTKPRVCVTTTPRPITLLQGLVGDAADPSKRVHMTRGSTYENYLHLAESYFESVVSRNKGSLSRQEIFAEMLDKIDGALWSIEAIDRKRLDGAPQLQQIVVAVDPAEESRGDSDEVGIVACGRDYQGRGYVLEDWSTHGSPAHWARRAYELWAATDADSLVVETNRGGQMIAHTIRSVIREGEARPRIVEVKASRGKATRAEPIAALYEEGRMYHVGTFSKLEDEMTTYVPGVTAGSPNRLDALVWAMTALFPSRRVFV